MLKLYLLATVFLIVSANVLEKYMGKVIPVMMYSHKNISEYCSRLEMSLPGITCNCDNDTVPALKYVASLGKVTKSTTIFGVQVVESETEALEALKKECTCDNKTALMSAFLPYNDNYFIVYSKILHIEKTETASMLFAKNKPTPKELNDFINSIDNLKDKNGSVMCTTETVVDPWDADD